MAAATKSEDILSRKVDLCIADTLIKIGGGLATGAVFSLFLFKRKTWPITLGVGFGAGMGSMNCQNKLNEPYLVMATRVKVKSVIPDKAEVDTIVNENPVVAEVIPPSEIQAGLPDTTGSTGATA